MVNYERIVYILILLVFGMIIILLDGGKGTNGLQTTSKNLEFLLGALGSLDLDISLEG